MTESRLEPAHVVSESEGTRRTRGLQVRVALQEVHQEFLCARDVAMWLGLPYETVRCWQKQPGAFPPSYKFGRKNYWRRTELEAWAESKRTPREPWPPPGVDSRRRPVSHGGRP